jgi:Cu/Ag efflux pump CusA
MGSSWWHCPSRPGEAGQTVAFDPPAAGCCRSVPWWEWSRCSLFGITLRNSILIVAHYDRLVRVDQRTWGVETAVRGAADWLAPILMTTLVTALGLLPLALGINEPGREIEDAMTVVILGGQLTSMPLNLLVLPTLALRFGRFEPTASGEL